MKECYAYIRVSTVKQGEKGTSLEEQRDAITAYAERHDITIIEWFEEQVTAAKEGRAEFSRLLKRLKRKRDCGVIFHKIDRGARNLKDWNAIQDLIETGVEVHFAHESLDMTTRGGRLTADMLAVIASDYVRNLRDEATKGIRGRLKSGLYPLVAPLGYVDNGSGKRKTLDPERAPLIAELFRLYVSGEYSMQLLVPMMDRRGLRSKGGKPLTKTGIERILGNPFYCGIMRVKTTGETFPGVHKPLITATVFKKAQRIREGRYRKKKTRHNHLFRGLFDCGLCDRAMIAERQKSYVYYRCHYASCPAKTTREENIDGAVKRLLRRYVLSDAQIADLKMEVRARIETTQGPDKVETLKLQLRNSEARLSRLDDKLIDDVIGDEVYKRKREELLIGQAVIKENLAREKKRNLTAEQVRKFLEQVKSLYSSYENGTKDEKRHIVNLASSNRLVLPKKVEIEPRNWLTAVENARNVPQCGLYRSTLRSGRHMRNKHIDRLIEAANSPEAAELLF